MDTNIPVFRMREATERRGLQALEEYKQGRTIKITNAKEVANLFADCRPNCCQKCFESPSAVFTNE